MDIKLLVLDVDGTLLNSNREMSERTVKTLKKVQQNGVRVALATGRPTYGVLPFAKAAFAITFSKVLCQNYGYHLYRRAI